MAKQPLTIFQRLTKTFGYQGQLRQPPPSFEFSKEELLRTDNKEDYERAALQAKQTQYIADKWSKLDMSLYNQSVYYEPNRLSAYYDYESMEFSISSESMIYTLEGFQTIKSLADKGRDYEFITYAYDHNKKQVVPALARNAHYTRDEMTYKITFDDGKFIIATYGHRFLKRNGVYCKVEDLKVGDSMMPFYIKSFYNNDNYNWIYSCNSNEGHHGWVTEHDLIAEWFYNRKKEEGEEVHHKDFNGKNNLPENLQIMNINEHRSYHAKIHNKKMWANPEYRLKMMEVAKSSKNFSWKGKRRGENNPSYVDISWDKVVEYSKEFKTIKETAKELNISIPKLTRAFKSHGYASWKHFINPNELDSKEINVGVNNPRYIHIPWDLLVETALKCKTQSGTSKVLNVSHHKIIKDIKRAGYDDWQTFIDAYDTTKVKTQKEPELVNHKISSIEPYGVVPVYDLTVPGYKNFATDTIFSHNTPEVSAALDIYSEESCTKSEKGEILTIQSDSKRIKHILDDLFYNVLDINTNIQMWTRGMCKYGDDFVYLKIDGSKGIIGCQQLPNIEVERIEGARQSSPNQSDRVGSRFPTRELRFAWKNKDMEFQAWEIAHFRILGDDRKLPYGTCLKSDSYINTENGLKEIQDINIGENVFSFDANTQKIVLSKVLDKVNSGIKETYKLSTVHNYIVASKEHNIMYYNTLTNNFDYKNVLDFKLGDLLVINKEFNLGKKIKIDKSLPDDYKKSQNYSEKNRYWKNIDLIPDYIDEEFAELFGFLIGDGCIDIPRNTICLALGNEEYLNEKYIKLLEKYSGCDIKCNKTLGRCYSKSLMTILNRLGFGKYSYGKRLPQWIFESSPSIREAVLNGLYEADGSINIDKWNYTRYDIELSNEGLVKDIKALVQSLGYKSGKISSRLRKNVTIKGKIVKSIRESFRFYYYKTKNEQIEKYEINNRLENNFILEPITSIETDGEYETYDIYVENENHNFYANGIVVHNSMLDKIRRIWKQLLLAEDAMLIYRTSRAPERRVFKVFVGNMDDKDIEPYVQRIANKFKRDQVVDQKNGNVDMRYNQMPVWKDTPIPLLDGRTITIEELSKEYDEGKENWVYSIQDKTLQVLPGKVVWCGKNYTAKRLIKVWLDDNTWIMTAPEHPYVLRDGSHKPAEDLKSGDSLMPYYTKKSSKKDGMRIEDYEMIYNPRSGKYEFVHRLVGNHVLSEERSIIKDETDFFVNNNLTIHHKDFNKSNNHPDNLEWIGNVDHMNYHKEIGRERLIKYNKSEKKREQNKRLAKEESWYKRFIEYNHSKLHKEHDKIRKDAQLKDWSSPEKKQYRSEKMRVNFDSNVFTNINENILSGKIYNRKTMLDYLSNDMIDYILSINNNKRLSNLKKIERTVLEREINNKGFDTITDYIGAIKLNHKVLRTEEIYGNEDVYCMTVVGFNGEEDRHNFAVKSFNVDGTISVSGSFTVNSVDQDYFIPVRDISQTSPIETLPGACISLDTEIPLLDGRTLSLNDIITEWDNGNRNLWVYSVDPKTGESAPGLITWAGVTRKNTDVLKITLDNGKEIISTPDHKFVHRTNGFVDAQDLVVGDSLMPFYRNEEFILPKKKYGKKYEKIWDNKRQEWVFTHRMVNNFMKEKLLETYFMFEDNFDKDKMKTIHHINNNRFNNNPNNLTLMDSRDHYQYHRFELWSTPEKREINIQKISKGLKSYINNLTEIDLKKRSERLKKYATVEQIQKMLEWRKNETNNKLVGLKISESFTNERKKRHSKICSNNWKDDSYRNKVFSKDQKIVFNDYVYENFVKRFKIYKRSDLTLDELNSNTEFLNIFRSINIDVRSSLTNLNRFTHNHVDKMVKEKGFKNFRAWKKSVLENNNHKIIKIEWLSDKIDTGTITVDGNEMYHNYHTFATSSGIYIKNSNLGEIADIEYIQKKMLAALRIPKAFLGFEDVIGNGKGLALLDIRFARTINRIQQSIIQELNKIALIHLFLLGLEDELNNFTLMLTNPSGQSDLLKIESWKEKITMYKDATSDQSQMGILPVSHTFAKKNFLGMSDNEVILDLQQQRMERAIGVELTNTAQIIKRTGVFDEVDKKYGISEEERAKIQTANPAQPPGGGGGGGGSSMSSSMPTEPGGAAGAPGALPAGGAGAPPPPGGEAPLSESTKKDKILSMLNEDTEIPNLFDNKKAQENIYEIDKAINTILNQ